eukprot:7805242-Alexandrium_andersonii.AAC.1
MPDIARRSLAVCERLKLCSVGSSSFGQCRAAPGAFQSGSVFARNCPTATKTARPCLQLTEATSNWFR